MHEIELVDERDDTGLIGSALKLLRQLNEVEPRTECGDGCTPIEVCRPLDAEEQQTKSSALRLLRDYFDGEIQIKEAPSVKRVRPADDGDQRSLTTVR